MYTKQKQQVKQNSDTKQQKTMSSSTTMRQRQQQQKTRIRSACATTTTTASLLFLLLLPVLSHGAHHQTQAQIHHRQQQQQQSDDTCSSYATPVVRHGTKFFNKRTGEYIPIKGINYYPRPNSGKHVETNSVDFLTESFRHVWERDIQYFQSLNVNVIRIYAVAPGLDHSGFMCACQAAGIYLIIGLAADCKDCAITKHDAPDCYPETLKSRGQFIIAEFARYDNVIAFSAGNEVSLSSADGALTNGVCQKKFIQDMREYIAGCETTVRHIPVGLATADVDRTEKALYYSCHDTGDENDMSSAEFIGLNSYLHCDGTIDGSEIEPLVGFETLLKDFASYQVGVPVILTELGCIDGSFDTIDDYDAQRNFLQVDALFSDPYREEFAGGVVFEYSTELVNSLAPYPFDTYGEGNFGIGYLSPEDCDDIDILCDYVPFPQFDTLATKYNAVDTSNEQSLDEYMKSYEHTSAPVCPAEFPSLDSFVWPSDSIENRECPGQVWVTCDEVPTECSNLGMLLFDDSNSSTLSDQPTNTPPPTSVPSTLPPVEPSSPTSKPTTKSSTMTPTTISPTTTATVPPTTPTTNTTFETIEETPAVDDEPDESKESTPTSSPSSFSEEEEEEEETSSSAVPTKVLQQWIMGSVTAAVLVVVVLL